MRIVELDQSGPDWLKWRHSGIGASESAAILGLNPWQSRESVFADKIQASPGESWDNEHTRRGKEREPKGRALYEALYGWSMVPVCGEHTVYPYIKASLDGRREDGRLILEMKAPSEKWHQHTIERGIPDWYYCQVQQQLLVSEASLAHFCSYRSEFPPSQRLIVLPVRPDSEFQGYLIDELTKFWQEVLEARAMTG